MAGAAPPCVPISIRRIFAISSADTFILTADFVNEIRVPSRRHPHLRAVRPRDQRRGLRRSLERGEPRTSRELVAAVVDENDWRRCRRSWSYRTGRRNRSGAPSVAPRLRWPNARSRIGALAPVATPDLAGHQTGGGARTGHLSACWGTSFDRRRCTISEPAGEEPRLRHGFRVYSGGLTSPTGKLSG